jgi:hypothetical protein
MTDDLQNFGPAMRALTEKQRAFVIAMLGFHETTEHKVTVDHGSGGDILQRIRDAASLLGVDPAQLLGANSAHEGDRAQGEGRMTRRARSSGTYGKARPL